MTKCTHLAFQVLNAQYRSNSNLGKTKHAHLFYFCAQKFITKADAEVKIIHKNAFFLKKDFKKAKTMYQYVV